MINYADRDDASFPELHSLSLIRIIIMIHLKNLKCLHYYMGGHN